MQMSTYLLKMENIVDSIKVNDLMICDPNYYWSDKWFIKKGMTCSWFVNADLPYTWFVSNERISLQNRLLLNSGLSSSFHLSSRFYKSVRRLKLIVKIMCNQVTFGGCRVLADLFIRIPLTQHSMISWLIGIELGLRQTYRRTVRRSADQKRLFPS